MQAGRQIKPNTRVRVAQTIHGRKDAWTCEVEGVVLSHQPEKSESWFAHGKNGRVWLTRIRLRKDDGEITTLNLDHDSRVTILKEPES
ncbi:MAG: hypothetical protein JSU68_11960 [Phycisphaerales bacterium]|nr:MAG: hypothetical protein JSU68_11960 [Phycisphaerales bacterium]